MAEPFPENVKLEACKQAGYRCQCNRTTCTAHSTLRCPVTFSSYTDAEYHHINRFGDPVVSNCQVLCHACHAQTQSYGKPT